MLPLWMIAGLTVETIKDVVGGTILMKAASDVYDAVKEMADTKEEDESD